MSANEPLIHYRTPLGRVLCGRRPAGGVTSPAGSNHVPAATTCQACRRKLFGER